MENRESRTESAEQKLGQRSQELGDQQRIDQKARALTAEQDGGSSSGSGATGGSRMEQQLGRVRQTEPVPDGDQLQTICDRKHMEEEILKTNTPPLSEAQKESLRERIAADNALIRKTPVGYCPD